MTSPPSPVRIPALFFALLGFGCAAVDPQPFRDYETATRRVQDGVDAVFLVDLQWTTEGFVQRIVDGSVDYRELTVEFPDDPRSFEVALHGAPLHHVIAKRERQVYRLNSAFAEYAALLTRLAGPEAVDQETFDGIARDLNDGVADAGRQLEEAGVSRPTGFDERMGLVSVAAAGSFRAYIEGRRRSRLGDALEKNQIVVERWSGLSVRALEAIRDDVQAEYARRKRAVIAEISGAGPEKRTKPARALLDLNSSVLEVMETLAALKRAYVRMPRAHADLAKSLEADGRELQGLEAFFRQASHLRDLHRDLAKKAESR